MKVSFACDNCGKNISTSSEHAGKKAKCPDCSSPVTIPKATTSTNVPKNCPDIPAVKKSAPPLPDPAVWFYSDGENRVGPVSKTKLKQLLTSKTINTETLLWKEGLEDWVAASDILKPSGSSTAPAGVGKVYCRSCGKAVLEQAVVCTSCGCSPKNGREFCPHCSKPTSAQAVVCMSCGGALSGKRSGSSKIPEKQMTSFFLCLFLGWVGAHRFYLKRENAALLLVVSIFTFGIAGSIWALLDLKQIAEGSFTDEDEKEIGTPVVWMQIVTWVCVGLACLYGIGILFTGCGMVLGGF